MKPYDFYKKKFKLKNPDKERKRKYTEKDNYDFPFFAGKDYEGKNLDMTFLIDKPYSNPDNKKIYNIQVKAFNNLTNKIKNNLGDNYEAMAAFIKDIGVQYSSKNSEDSVYQYKNIKTIQSDIYQKIKNMKINYNINSESTEETILKSLRKIKYQDRKKQIEDLEKDYNNLLTILNDFAEATDSTQGIVDWKKLNSYRMKLQNHADKLKELKELPNGKKFRTKFVEMLKEDSLDSYWKAIDSAANFLSGAAGEYVVYQLFEKAIRDHNGKGKKWLDMVNTGALYEKIDDSDDTKSIQMRIDHIIITEENKSLNLKLKLNKGKAPINITLGELKNFLIQTEKEAKKAGTKYKIEISNWDEIIKSNKLNGYTIQTKFRQKANSILNDNRVSKYSINELIAEAISSGNEFYAYAHMLDLFVRWYRTSAEYWRKYAADARYPSRVLASYSTEKEATSLYGNIFNYLLSRTEAIEKIYAPTLFWYITTGGGFSLENYKEKKLKQINDSIYALLSARSPVDISQPDKPITINISHLSPTYKRDKRNPNNK